MGNSSQTRRAIDRQPDLLALVLPLALYVVATAAFLFHSSYSRTDFPLDDAWTHRVYSQAFAMGQGFAYNATTQEAGATSPLWVIVSSPAHWLAFVGPSAVTLAVKLIGAALGGLAVGLVFFIGRRLGESDVVGSVAACLFAIDPRLPFAALSGMEIVALVALWLGLTWAGLTSRRVLAVFLLGWMVPTRPEAALVLPLAWAGLFIAWGATHPFWRRPVAWLLLVGPTALWIVFCLAVTGHPLPNTFYVKARGFELGLEQARQAASSLIQHGWGSYALLAVGLAAFVVRVGARQRRNLGLPGALLVAAPLIYVLGVLGTREYRLDGFYWTRWTDPPALVLGAASSIGLGALLVAGLSRLTPLRLAPDSLPATWRAPVVLFAVLAAVALVAGSVRLVGNLAERRERLATDSRAIRKINVEAGLWIREHTPGDAVVAVNDAGAIRYFGQRRTIDLVGLNYRDIAFRTADPVSLMREIDWLAVFPDWFQGAPFLQQFEDRVTFGVPVAEYTPCPCPAQAVKLVAERRSGTR